MEIACIMGDLCESFNSYVTRTVAPRSLVRRRMPLLRGDTKLSASGVLRDPEKTATRT